MRITKEHLPKELLHDQLAIIQVPSKEMTLFEYLSVPEKVENFVVRIFINIPFGKTHIEIIEKIVVQSYENTSKWDVFQKRDQKQGYVLIMASDSGLMNNVKGPQMHNLWLTKDDVDTILTKRGILPENATDEQLADAMINYIETAQAAIAPPGYGY